MNKKIIIGNRLLSYQKKQNKTDEKLALSSGFMNHSVGRTNKNG